MSLFISLNFCNLFDPIRDGRGGGEGVGLWCAQRCSGSSLPASSLHGTNCGESVSLFLA
jgi:hypothetical protein